MTKKKNSPVWPMRSSQEDAIKEILAAGGTVQLSYIVTPKDDDLANKKIEAKMKAKQTL